MDNFLILGLQLVVRKNSVQFLFWNELFYLLNFDGVIWTKTYKALRRLWLIWLLDCSSSCRGWSNTPLQSKISVKDNKLGYRMVRHNTQHLDLWLTVCKPASHTPSVIVRTSCKRKTQKMGNSNNESFFKSLFKKQIWSQQPKLVEPIIKKRNNCSSFPNANK